jgi:Holliday junction resolvase
MAQEKNFENKIKKFLDENNCWYVKYFANGYTKRGVPDLLCCVNGYFLAIEVKAENGKPSELQKWNVSKIRHCGGLSFILYPSQFENFKELVKTMKSFEPKKIEVLNKIDPQVLRNLYGVAE